MYYNYAMIELNIPGWRTLRLNHLVCDVNGTLALDGRLMDGLFRPLTALRDRLDLHLITANTHGRQAEIDHLLGIESYHIHPGDEAHQKAEFVRQLGADEVVAVGQGANDAEMLETAGLGIAVLSREGLAVKTLLAADLVVPDIYCALELLEKPMRIVATMRI